MATDSRARTLYVKSAHQRVWRQAEVNAAAQGVSLSEYVASALASANDKAAERKGESQ